MRSMCKTSLGEKSVGKPPFCKKEVSRHPSPKNSMHFPASAGRREGAMTPTRCQEFCVCLFPKQERGTRKTLGYREFFGEGCGEDLFLQKKGPPRIFTLLFLFSSPSTFASVVEGIRRIASPRRL